MKGMIVMAVLLAGMLLRQHRQVGQHRCQRQPAAIAPVTISLPRHAAIRSEEDG